ncbi:MAG TPA: hypothetical protein VN086_02650 [Candidatus Paceibacterota bacterium]|nr:hypothetical protein [Candidatus Paceibacterota bacterium]
MPEIPTKITDAWDDRRAEAAFHNAFSKALQPLNVPDLPIWLRGFERPFTVSAHSAVAIFRSGKQVRLKVLASEDDVETYKESNPLIPVVLVIESGDSATTIIWKTIRALQGM